MPPTNVKNTIPLCIKLKEWQEQSIIEGLKDIEAGYTTPHADVLAKWEAKAGK